MQYVLGIDQGASKTHAIIADGFGRILGLGKGDGACHSSGGMAKSMCAVKDAVNQALQQSGLTIDKVQVLVAGMTGVDWEHEEKLLESELKKEFAIKTIVVVNDCIIALRAGTKKRIGAVLCAGSGLNCAVKKDEHTEYVYGFYIEDEHQGGASLGRAVLKAVCNAHSGMTKPTKLTKLVLDHFAMKSVDELLYNQVCGKISNAKMMSLSLILEDAAALNDQVALDILANYGTNIAAYVVAGMEKLAMLDCDIDVVLSGSIFKCKIPVLREAVTLGIHRHAAYAKIVNSVYEPIIGALLLCIDKLHGETPIEVYQNIEIAAATFNIKR